MRSLAALLAAAVCLATPIRAAERPLELLFSGDAERALELFRTAVAVDPTDAAAVAGEIEALLATQRVEEALSVAASRFDALGSSAAVRSAYGRALFRAGALERAMEILAVFETEGAAAPPRGLIALARLYAASGESERGAALAARALEQTQEDPFVIFWAAELISERSEALLRQYLEISPGGQPDWIEAARGTLRVKKALGARAVWRYDQTPDRVVLPLRLVWDDLGRKLGYVVEARVGDRDKPVRLLLDTGSTGLFLVERMARRRGFEFLAEEVAFGGGGKKRHRNRRGIFSRFRLGALRFVDALAGTTRRELEPFGKFHGLLGIQALHGYRVTLDLKAQTMTLEHIQPDAIVDAEATHYWFISGQMLVRAESSATASGLFLFDTGATWSVLSNSFLTSQEEIASEPTRNMRGFGGTIRDASIVRGTELHFQGLTTGQGDLRAFDLSVRSAVGDVEISGFIGLDLLDAVRITIDTVAQTVRVDSLR